MDTLVANPAAPGPESTDWLAGGGELGDLIRTTDWAATPLGPRHLWPPSLRVTVQTVVASRFPMALLWGPDLLLLYNDAYRVIAGDRHPGALGRSTTEVWQEVWHINEPIFRAVMDRGESLFFEDKPFPIRRNGRVEQAYFTLGYSPVRGEDGTVAGTLVLLQETTAAVERLRRIGEDEALLRAVVDFVPEPLFLKDPDSRWRLANPATLKAIGKSLDEVLGKTDLEIYADRHIAHALVENDRRILDSGQPQSFEEVVQTPDGERTFLSTKAPFRDAAGTIVGLIGHAMDITAWKSAEEFRAFRRAIDQLPIGLLVLESPGGGPTTVLARNEAYARIVVVPSAGPPPTAGDPPPYRLFLPDRTTEVPFEDWPGVRAARTGQTAPHVERHVRRSDGSWRVMLVGASPIQVESGGTAGRSVVVALDITERREAQGALATKESLLAAILDGTADGILVVGHRGTVLRTNRRFLELWRIPADLAAGSDDARLLAHVVNQLADPPGFLREVERLYDVAEPVLDQIELADGRTFERFSAPFAFDGPRGRLWSFRDVTPQRSAERALRASEARFRTLTAESPVGVFETDAAGGMVYVNRKASAIMGMPTEEASGDGWRAGLLPASAGTLLLGIQAAIRDGNDFRGEGSFQHRDGTTVVVQGHAAALHDGRGLFLGHVGVLVDVTEQRALEEQLAVTSRLAALGTLVAGVAHEINNPLAGEVSGQGYAIEEIAGIVRDLRSGTGGDPEALIRRLGDVAEALEDAQAAGLRIAAIVKDLARFARPDVARTRLHLADGVENALRWLPAAVQDSATIRVEDGNPPDVSCSEGLFFQVLVNLVTNAARSIPKGKRGTITIRLAPGRDGTARVEVEDDGGGMPPEVLKRVFDPFFTTRQPGQGTGLGLAVSHSIVASHGGTITATSEVGKGSIFRVELPAVT